MTKRKLQQQFLLVTLYGFKLHIRYQDLPTLPPVMITNLLWKQKQQNNKKDHDLIVIPKTVRFSWCAFSQWKYLVLISHCKQCIYPPPASPNSFCISMNSNNLVQQACNVVLLKLLYFQKNCLFFFKTSLIFITTFEENNI